MAQLIQGSPRKNAGKTRGRPFEKGNPGRPKGSRNKATLAAEAILDGEAEALTRKTIELALNGDLQALRICLDRLLAPRRERPVRFTLPPINAGADASKAIAALISAVAHGELSPGEAASLVQMVEAHSRVLLVCDLEQRLSKLEAEDK
jgi:Family of unknown function (DUF5681)